MFKQLIRNFHSSIPIKGYSQNTAYGYGIPITGDIYHRIKKDIKTLTLNLNQEIDFQEIKEKNNLIVINTRSLSNGSILFAGKLSVKSEGCMIGSEIRGPLPKLDETLPLDPWKLESYFRFSEESRPDYRNLEKVLLKNNIKIKELAIKYYPMVMRPQYTGCIDTPFDLWLRDIIDHKKLKGKTLKDFYGRYLLGLE